MRSRRSSVLVLCAAAAAVMLVPASARAACDPTLDPTCVPPHPSTVSAVPPHPATVSAWVKGLRNGHAKILSRVRFVGRLAPYRANQTVKVYLYKGTKRVFVRELPVKKVYGENDGAFATYFRVRDDGNYTVWAKHPESPELAAAHSTHKHFDVYFPGLHNGDRGPEVKLFNHLLDRVGYVYSDSRRYDSATGRGVLAFRRVNHLHQTTRTATADMFRRLFHHHGGYPLRHPRAGHHVEVDLSLQVMALSSSGEVVRAYAISSGKPSTPTIRGRFRFYRRQPGYNFERMYYSVYFHGGYAIHGYSSVPNYAASHGCVREFIADARNAYNWVRLGDPIYVYG
jgi:hypothetical protein